MPQVFETTDGVYDKERKLGGLKLVTGQFWALLVKSGEVQKYSFMQGENLLTENLREMLTIKIRIIIMV